MLAPETRALLAGHEVVLLDVGLSAAASRVGLSRDRPVLALNPRAQLRALLEQRQPLYREVAVRVVATDGRTVDEVADEVLFFDDGVILERGAPKTLLTNPSHERTRRFLDRILRPFEG